MKKSIFIILIAVLLVSLTHHLAIADEKISPLTATASSYYYRGYEASYAVDENLNTKWIGKYNQDTWWIKFDTGKVHSISKVVTYWYKYGYAAGRYDILISSDDTNWIIVHKDIKGVYGPNGDVRKINRDARYIMFEIYSTQGPPMPAIEEFEAYKSAGSSNQPPIAQASANPASGVAPLTVQFKGDGSSDPDGTVVSYNWTFGDGQSSNAQNPTHTYNNPGTYGATLTVTDNDGATDTDSVTITVNELANQSPTAKITADKTSGDAPLEVHFTGDTSSDSDGTVVLYYWDFGDGETSNAENPIHVYQNPGTYVATLTVTDDDGATDDASVTIVVGEPSSGGVPHLMRFQGNLGDADEQPLNGIFTLTFRIYDAETGGTPLWEEVQENIDIEKGFLDILLGSVTSLDLPFDKQYWLGVEVESDGEMTPRFKLTTVPYSFTSEK